VVVLDNLKEGVAVPDIYDPTINPLFRDVLAHYGAVALPCRIQDPDRKGKVESGIGYTKRTALKGMRFESLQQAQTYLDRWEERWADRRIHGTTKRQVAAMFAEGRGRGWLAGDFVLGVLDFFAEGQHGEKLVPAGDATKGWHSQRAPKRGGEAVGQFGRDTFYFDIAADAAMRREEMGQRRGAGVETFGAARTAPWNDGGHAKNKVSESAPARAAAIGRITCWAIHRVLLDLSELRLALS
jgi:hypothetical protein